MFSFGPSSLTCSSPVCLPPHLLCMTPVSPALFPFFPAYQLLPLLFCILTHTKPFCWICFDTVSTLCWYVCASGYDLLDIVVLKRLPKEKEINTILTTAKVIELLIRSIILETVCTDLVDCSYRCPLSLFLNHFNEWNLSKLVELVTYYENNCEELSGGAPCSSWPLLDESYSGQHSAVLVLMLTWHVSLY